MKRYYHTDSILPHGFRFPQTYLDFVTQDPIEDLDPWVFFCEYEEDADFWVKELARQYPKENLVPFAKVDFTDDVACFEGEDHSGNPSVSIIHAFASPGWEQRGKFADFTEWLEEAKLQSAQYKADSGMMSEG